MTENLKSEDLRIWKLILMEHPGICKYSGGKGRRLSNLRSFGDKTK
jgi:hypothetical protein